ncbi:MAG: hypothetical protein KGJ61_09000 [Candidatus Omnitrophica bacterium]|nr:hypothetical protein [Candidatus Omnitrophota bacterium]
MVKTLREIIKACCICGASVHRYNAKYCLRCAKFGARMRTKHFPPATVAAIWAYIKKYGYVCYYTGLPLNLDNDKSPLYLVFDHWIPGDPSKVVICCSFVNEMKSDMTQDEFEDTCCQLADHFRKGTPVVLKPFVYWDRIHPVSGGD